MAGDNSMEARVSKKLGLIPLTSPNDYKTWTLGGFSSKPRILKIDWTHDGAKMCKASHNTNATKELLQPQHKKQSVG
jgi:hypothetical protein